MKIKKWVLQAEDGRFLSYNRTGNRALTTKLSNAITGDTKQETIIHYDKLTGVKPERLTFELVDMPTGKPAIYKWVIQITGATKFSKYYQGRYIAQKARENNNIVFVEAVDKATIFDHKNDAIYAFYHDNLRWRVKKLVFELV
jgi:hypothetical protein